jgi:hypothetical protein
MKTSATLLLSALALAAAPTVLGQGAPSKKQVVRTDLMTGYQEAVQVIFSGTAPAIIVSPGPGTISSVATGQFVAEIDDELQTITFVLTYEDIEGGPTTQAHIHFGARGISGGVSAFLCGGGTKPAACPPVAGTVEGVITPLDVIGPAGQGIEPITGFPELVRAMRSGVAYVNVHSTRWPTGEIRGQISDHNERQVK